MLPETTETGPDENGYYTRVEYRINERNNQVKIITRFKKFSYTSKVYPSVIERRDNWVKFGKALDNTGVTTLSDELVFMEPPSPKNKNTVENTFENLTENINSREGIIVVCKKCNGPHWTRVCDFVEEKKYDRKNDRKDNRRDEKEKVNNLPKNTVVQVTNLGKTVDEADLFDLFNQVGFVKRVSIVKDYESQESKGLGYVLFDTEDDAEKAIKTFNNSGFNHLILNLKIVH